MAQVGSLEWVVQAKQAGEAKAQVEEVGESFSDTAEQAEQAEESTAGFSDVLGAGAGALTSFGTRSQFLRQSLSFLQTALTFTTARLKALSVWAIRAGTSLASTGLGAAAARIGTLVSSITGLSASAFAGAAAIGAFLGTLGVVALEVTGVLDAIQGLGNAIGTRLPQWAQDGFAAFVTAALPHLSLLGSAVLGFVEGFLKGGLVAGLRRARERVGQMLGIMTGSFQRSFGRLRSLNTKFFTGLVSIFTRGFNRLMSILSRWTSSTIATFLRGVSRLQGLIRRFFNQTVTFFSSGFNRFARLVTTGIGRIRSIFSSGFNQLVSMASMSGAAVIDEFVSGIDAGISEVQSAASEVAETVDNHLPGSPADTGPLSDLDKAGPGLTATLSSGMEANTGQLEDAATSVASAANPTQASPGGSPGGSSGGGQDTPTEITYNIEIGDQALDMSTLSRRDLERLADLIAEKQGDELKRLLGT